MSSVKLGAIAPFPPLPGQPYPPARNHPRWKELYRLHDEWIMKYWPFSSQKKRARLPFTNLAGYSTWGAPCGDFDRLVLICRLNGTFFLADDYLDSGQMHDRIPGFKKVSCGTGPLHPKDRAEICQDVIFRAIKATARPETFSIITKLTHEWWDTHSDISGSFGDLDHYLKSRRLNVGIYMSPSFLRYALDINLTEEQTYHPLMREAEGIACDHVALANDLFSYMKEVMDNSDGMNILRLLQDVEGLTYEEAKEVVIKRMKQKEQDYIPAGLAVLNDPELGKAPDVRRWIATLPYCMGGNVAWSQESGRYNVGEIPGGVAFPSLSYEIEDIPADELIDDTEETLLRNAIFGVKDIPPPDFTPDCDPIEAGNISTESAIPAHLFLPVVAQTYRGDVGILAIDVYLPRRYISRSECETVKESRCHEHDLGEEYITYVDDLDDINSIALSTVSSLLKKYKIDPHKISRLGVCCGTALDKSESVKSALIDYFKRSGNMDIEVLDSKKGPFTSTTALFDAVSWVQSHSGDSRNAIVFAGDIDTRADRAAPVGGVVGIALLIGPNAPIVVEPSCGTYFTEFHSPDSALEEPAGNEQLSTRDYHVALEEAYTMYKRKRCQEVTDLYNKSAERPDTASDGPDDEANGINDDGMPPVVSLFDFDYMIYDTPYDRIDQQAHSYLHRNEYPTKLGTSTTSILPDTQNVPLSEWLNNEYVDDSFIKLAMDDYKQRVLPSSAISKRCGSSYAGQLFGALASLLDAVPSYDIFEHRISIFEFGPEGVSSFFAVRIKGDTKYIRDAMDLKARLEAM